MRCPVCEAENDAAAASCFTCGRAFDALTRGLVLSGRYEIRKPVGSGGMGRVYEAFDRRLEEPVAIKVLRAELTREPDIQKRFVSEMKLARTVSHRNVCRIHEYNEDAGLAFISMEYIEGRSLKSLLRDRTLPYDEAYELSVQVAEGLAAIHEHGIVHRDFKTANIMVDGRGVAKILDFGIAKRLGEHTTGLTTDGQVFGTPEYMSPEQVEGGTVDARSDIYALGCVVYEIFVTRPPFVGETPYATLLKHLNDPPPLDPALLGLPPALLSLLARCLAKDPGLRFHTATDVIAALRRAKEKPNEATQPSRTVPLAARPSPAAPAAPQASSDATPAEAPAGYTVTLMHLRALRKRVRLAWGLGAAGAVVLALAFGLRGGAPSNEPSPPLTMPASAPAAPVPANTLAVAPSEAPPPTPAPTSAPLTTPARASRGASATPAPTPAASATPLPIAATKVIPAPHPSAPPTTLAAEAAAAPPTTVAAARGTLALIVVPDAEVEIDDQPIGLVSRRDVALATGPHALRVLHPLYEPLPRRFTIRAGETLTLLLDLQEKGIPKIQPKKKP
jgi:serine/threonine-protein kinase